MGVRKVFVCMERKVVANVNFEPKRRKKVKIRTFIV